MILGENMTDAWIRLRPVPKELGELIRQGNSIRSAPEGVEVSPLSEAKSILINIADRFSPAYRYHQQWSETRPPVTIGTSLSINSAGKIVEIPHPLIKMLRGVEASRIRLCLRVGCGKIFWAGREDSFSCSKKCNDAAKQRIRRAKGRSYEEKEKHRIYQRERRERIRRGGKLNG